MGFSIIMLLFAVVYVILLLIHCYSSRRDNNG